MGKIGEFFSDYIIELILLLLCLIVVLFLFFAFDCGLGKDVKFTGTIVGKKYHSGYYQTFYINNQTQMNYIPEQWKFTVKCKDGIHYTSVRSYTYETTIIGQQIEFKAKRGLVTKFDYSSY